jgi:hypothetical protein
MPVWKVQVEGGDDEQVEAGMLLLESGALVAFSAESLVVRAWAPGQWRTVQHITGPHEPPDGNGNEGANVVVELTHV